MRAGKLRHVISIQREQTDADGSPSVSDDIGGRTLLWVDVLTGVRAEVRPLTARERFFADQVQDSRTHLVRMRYRDGIVPAMRVLWNTRVFNIRGVRVTDEVKHEMELDTEEGVAT